jgi:hypothetical protein
VDTTVIDQTRSKIQDGLAQLEALAQSDDFDPADDSFKTLQRNVERDKARLETLTRAVSERSEIQRIDEGLSRTVKRHDDEAKRAGMEQGSWGEMFTRSQQFQGYNGYGTSGRVDVPNLE